MLHNTNESSVGDPQINGANNDASLLNQNKVMEKVREMVKKVLSKEHHLIHQHINEMEECFRRNREDDLLHLQQIEV